MKNQGAIQFDNPELCIDDLGSCSVGANSLVYINAVPKTSLGKIRIVCGNNCMIMIRGIAALNSSLFIFMNDGACLDMGSGQLFNGHFDILLHEPSAIRIGMDCLWGSGQLMTSDCHSIIDCETKQRINPAKDIFIADRVWLGTNVKVLKGASVASDTVIASCSIVTTGEYPKNSILAGSPAKVVKTGIEWDPRLL